MRTLAPFSAIAWHQLRGLRTGKGADFRVSHAVVFALGFIIDVSDPFAETGQGR